MPGKGPASKIMADCFCETSLFYFSQVEDRSQAIEASYFKTSKTLYILFTTVEERPL